MEGNAGGHPKAADIMEKCQLEYEMLKNPYPPNSPDLNMIEGLWDYEKDRVEEYHLRWIRKRCRKGKKSM